MLVFTSKAVELAGLLFIFIVPSASTMRWNHRQMRHTWPSTGKRSPTLCQDDALGFLLLRLLWIIDLTREGCGEKPGHLHTAHSPAGRFPSSFHKHFTVTPLKRGAVQGVDECTAKGKWNHGGRVSLDVSQRAWHFCGLILR